MQYEFQVSFTDLKCIFKITICNLTMTCTFLYVYGGGMVHIKILWETTVNSVMPLLRGIKEHTQKTLLLRKSLTWKKKKFKNIPRVACSFIAVMRTFNSLHQLVCRWTAFPWEAPSLSSFLPQDLVLSPTVFSGRLRPLTSRLMSSTQAARLWQTLWMYNKHKVLHILRRHLDFCPWLRRWVLTSGLHSRSCWLIILRNKLPSGLGNFIIRLEIHWFGEFPQFLLASKSPASKGGEAHWR